MAGEDLARLLAEAVKRIRGEETQAEFAKRLGLTMLFVSKVECGAAKKLVDLSRMAWALKVDPRDLLFGEKAPKASRADPPAAKKPRAKVESGEAGLESAAQKVEKALTPVREVGSLAAGTAMLHSEDEKAARLAAARAALKPEDPI